MNVVMEFDLTRPEIDLKLKNTQGKVEDYKLIGFDGSTREDHLNYMLSRTATDAKNPDSVRVTNFKGLQSYLVSLCLFRVVKDAAGQVKELMPVPQAEIAGYPAGVLTRLHQEAEKLNNVGQANSIEAAKNVSPASGTNGSDSPNV